MFVLRLVPATGTAAVVIVAMYMLAVMTAALTAVLAREPGRRRDARAVLAILVHLRRK
jgi:hypothetical protein